MACYGIVTCSEETAMSNKVLHRSSLVMACLLAGAALAQTPSHATDPRTDRTDGNSNVPGNTTMPGNTTERSSMHASAATRKPLTAQSFAEQAAVIGKAEIELGKLALKNSQDAQVQKFAQRMITDHSNADKQLQSIATQQSLTLPQKLDTEHQALMDKLSDMKGAQFDREYSKAMSEGHDKAVALFEAASRDPQMPAELKQFASTTLPTLESHRDMAHSMKGDVKRDKRS